jgi:CBS domain-containing protein
MDVRNLKLSELITKPITVGPSMSLMKTRESILKHKVKRVIVTDKKKPIKHCKRMCKIDEKAQNQSSNYFEQR